MGATDGRMHPTHPQLPAVAGSAWRIVQIYWRRLEVEQSFRFLKSEVGLESFRVRAFAAIERLVALGMSSTRSSSRCSTRADRW